MAGAEIVFDESRFLQLWEQLSEENRVKVMRQAYRRSGQKLRQEVIRQIKSDSTRLRWDPSMRSSVRLLVFRRKIGFRVTVGTKGRGKNAKGYHTNRNGQQKPVLMWAETGTVDRIRRKNKGRTGKLEPGRFMERARDIAVPAIQEELKDILMTTIVKSAARNGIH